MEQCLPSSHLLYASIRLFALSSATIYAHQTLYVYLSQLRPTEGRNSNYIWPSFTQPPIPCVTSFTYVDGTIVPVDSSNPSTTSTPNLSNYDFVPNAPTYPTPGQNSPHPYPIQLQQAYPTTVGQQAFNYRTQPTRAQTNNAYVYSAQPLQGYGHRRRSLSTSDANRIAAANSINNPTFIRLQTPRARSATPEDRRRNGLHAQHGRSANQGPTPRGGSVNPTSTPYRMYSDSFVGGMLPTPIGTPLSDLTDVQELNYDTGYNSTSTAGRTSYLEGPVFRQMTRPEEFARSRHVIEIGALVVSNRSRLDTRLEPRSPTADRVRILEKLGDIEEHLRDKEGEEALPACMTIRVTLSRNMNAEDVNAADSVGKGHPEGPTKEHTESQRDMYDGHDDNEIMEMLMRDNDVDSQEEEENGNRE
ncbi:hypothetical protein G6011_04319 [Alternaria panax]|uniref:Uncharacterized protein n=1 Tax=Alternaria panax TaxID=48097 RepID=A0AAD4IH35_9PLEO|nr:hypothetical protein G6011_04319 [Alternaria panax]